jgi:hypothetical protein
MRLPDARGIGCDTPTAAGVYLESGSEHFRLVHAKAFEGLVGAVPVLVESRDGGKVLQTGRASVEGLARKAGVGAQRESPLSVRAELLSLQRSSSLIVT